MRLESHRWSLSSSPRRSTRPVEASFQVRQWNPAVTIKEEADRFLLIAEVPGLEREQLDLEVKADVLILSGRRPEPDIEGRYLVQERGHGTFRRAFCFGWPLERAEITAKLEQGELIVIITKPQSTAESTIHPSAE